MCDLERAAGVADIGLDDVDAALIDDLAKPVARGEVLTARDRHGRLTPYLEPRHRVVPARRLLEPSGADLAQRPGDPDGLGRRKAAVALHVDLDIGPDRVPDGAQDGQRAAFLVGRQLVAAGPE